MLDNYNLNPYYDDYNDDKNFHRLLFKPSFAVQARELTQIQTIQQKQIERFGSFVFKNGSAVTGGQFTYQGSISLKLDNEYSNTSVDVLNFDNKSIYSIDETKRAEVIKVYDTDVGANEPKTVIIKQLYGEAFQPGETIKTNDTSPYFATISANGVSGAKTFSIDEGVFYFEGVFVRTVPQTIAISKYTDANVSCRVGFDVVESVVKASSDTSLLDPALGSSNYQAPGADRVKIDLVLTTRTLESTDDEKFIEVTRIENSTALTDSNDAQLSVIAETLARRTYDESGNYVVKPFNISLQDNALNSAQTDIILSPGKAYVYGYEFVSPGPTVITVDKPRDTLNTNNKRITAEYGNFLYTTKHYKSFPINSLGTVDIHCVPLANIDTTSAATISNTKIGSAKVKTIEYESATNSSDSNTYVYRTFLFDVAINQQVTGNVRSVTGTTIVIGDETDSYSNTANAYQGAKLRITSGPGSAEPVKTITNYNNITRSVTINQPFLFTPTTSSVFSIDFDVKDAESLATYSGTSLVNGANIDSRSKDLSKEYQDVSISDSKLEPMLFVLGEEYITPNTITDMIFSYRKLYSSQQFTSSNSPDLKPGGIESLASGGSEPLRNENFIITVNTQGTSPYPVGSIIPSSEFTVEDGIINVTNGNNMVADIVTTINVSDATRKSKIYVPANTTIQTSGGVDVFEDVNANVITYGTQGQTHIKAAYVNKIPGTAQSLFVSDVNNIVSILDFNGRTITLANTTSASEIITKYDFDDGQRDSYYDHSAIRLKSGVQPPVGPLVVFYDRFTSTGSGFFTVDSYTREGSGILYGNIPTYTSPTNNDTYELRDVLDFRPVRLDATPGSGSTVLFDVNSSTTGPKILKNGSDVIVDYSYYLPRIDRVVLDKSKVFEVIKGNSKINPAVPDDTSTTMGLYILRYGAYVADSAQIQVEYINNKRYTMRDIGTLEKRIENLEYYTSLSLLEQETVNKQDSTIREDGIPRFKNGILVDSFTGSSVADVTNTDYSASIDPNKHELRPSFNISSYSLTFDAANSTNFLQSGPFVTSSAASVVLIEQPKASRFINVNPFNVVNFLGKITLNPSSDVWIDTVTKPDVLVNLTGDLDAWERLIGNASVTEWGNWQTRWTGTRTDTFTEGNNWWGFDFFFGFGGGDTTTVTTETTTENQTRSGVVSRVVPATITRSIGDRIVDVTVVPYMRSINVLIVGTDFKPNVTVYPFFDGVSVENNVGNRVNKFYLTSNNIQLKKTVNDPEVVIIRDGNTIVGEAIVAHHSNNVVYVTNVSPTQPFANSNTSFTITGNTTGILYNVTGYEHNGANATSSTINTITLRQDAAGARNVGSYVGLPIFIVQGTGAGQTRTITNYNPATRVATVNANWSVLPDTTSFYSIGRMRTDQSGSVVGIFTIPEGTFRIGEKLLRLVDNSSGDIGSSSTNGDATFFAQGVLTTTEDTIISATVPQIQRVSISENRVVETTRETGRTQNFVGGWSDPLAQTFLISPIQYPQGIFLSKIRLCFKSKDESIPVTLQIRPTVNGYPSSSVIYPYGTVSLTPDKVKITESPSLDDETKYTDFIFDAPIYMQPGEHSFVILANSNKYETYIAEIGKTDLIANRLISEQAYGGSLFISQNGSTWTADQNSDMMFKMFRYNFSTSPSVAKFIVDYPETSNTPYDLTHLITGDAVLANTSLNYSFNSEALSGGYVLDTPIQSASDYDMNDGFGTRVFNPATGNTTFVLNAALNNSATEVSPFIDVSRMGFLAVHNRINNLGLSNNNITLISGGSGYDANTPPTITITGGGGSGAAAAASVSNTGIITAINIVSPGNLYTGTPTITITGGGSGASAIITGETSKKGGPAEARYISRRVTLNDTFDSGDIRVYLNAYRPKQSNIYVYVKLLSISDSDIFEDKEWQLLTQIGNANFVSTNSNDYRELIFAPGENGIASNQISYTTNGVPYDSFRTFAIKIVMAGTNSADVPKIRDMRAIALPAV